MSPTQTNKFSPGTIVGTANAVRTVPPEEIQKAISRHLSSDWGDCCSEDQRENDEALVRGDRIFSVYNTAEGITFWIITEADRSATTVMLPEDY
ncbi:MAG: hypothetical protein COA78_12655 [Blastopirellula sp.]|nr:MAG: hypothetical protein COA78_12655 [Blastopirellula sp.]